MVCDVMQTLRSGEHFRDSIAEGKMAFFRFVVPETHILMNIEVRRMLCSAYPLTRQAPGAMYHAPCATATLFAASGHPTPHAAHALSFVLCDVCSWR